MCFPVNCLKSLLSAGTGLTLIASILTVGFGFWTLYEADSLSKDALFIDQAKAYKNIIEYGLFILGAILFFVSCFGLWGAKKRNNCCLFLFQIGTLLLTLLFLTFGILSNQLGHKILNGDCSSIEWSQEISSLSTFAETSFCQDPCICFIDQTKFTDPTVVADLFQTTDHLVSNTTQFQQCQEFNSSLTPAFAFLSVAENLFECSGWCTQSKYYLFSDINRGNTGPTSCFIEVQSFFQSNGDILSYVFYGVGGFLGLMMVIAFCLCCSPTRKEKRRNFYHKMRVYDN